MTAPVVMPPRVALLGMLAGVEPAVLAALSADLRAIELADAGKRSATEAVAALLDDAVAASRPQPKPVRVSAWGELRGERRLQGCLHVLVDGQSAGGAERTGGSWVATWYAGMTSSGALIDRTSVHENAEDAVRAVIRSRWARRLGARAASPVFWSAKAGRLAGRGDGAR